jgi:hypothetical protein
MFKLYRFVFTAVVLIFTCEVSFAQKENDKPASYNDKVLYGGCWFVPHNSGINIRFSEYSNFRFQDIDSTEREVVVTGKYLLDGHNLWLIYDDRPKQKFYFYKTEGPEEHFVIRGYPLETSEYHFVHGDCE